MLLLIAASVRPRFSDTGLSNDESHELATELNIFSQKAKQSIHKETHLSSKQELSETRLASEIVQDSAVIGQAGRPTKERGNITKSTVSELLFSFLLSHTK